MKLTWSNREYIGPESSEHIWDTFADGSGECALFERRQLIGDDVVHLGQFSKSVTHFVVLLMLLQRTFIFAQLYNKHNLNLSRASVSQ